MTVASLQAGDSRVTVTCGRDFLEIREMWDCVIRPLLIASGYEAATVDSLVPHE